MKTGTEEEATSGVLIKVMRENTFVKVIEGMHRFRYMECPVAKEMLRYKY